MKTTLSIAAALAALLIGTQAFAAGPAPAAGSATTAPAATSATTPSGAATVAPAAGAVTSGQPAAPAASSTAAPASKQAAATAKIDATSCADYQKRVDDAIAGHKDAAKLDQAKKSRDEGAKLCSTGKHEAGVKLFQTALKDLGVSKTQ